MGSAVQRATCSGYCTASDFGTNSPSTTCKVVSTSRTLVAAIAAAAFSAFMNGMFSSGSCAI